MLACLTTRLLTILAWTQYHQVQKNDMDLESIFIALEDTTEILDDDKAALYVKLMDRIVHHHSSYFLVILHSIKGKLIY